MFVLLATDVKLRILTGTLGRTVSKNLNLISRGCNNYSIEAIIVSLFAVNLFL